ncbi:MAG: COX15/CtaA family protein [Rhodothermales bacterium]
METRFSTWIAPLDSRQRRFAGYAWGVLAYMVLVILWGAFVRATGSGAGCGSHWPLCNGEVVPQAPAVETLIELSHRLTSALAGFLVIGLVVWAFRVFPKGHIVRKGAIGSLVFVITEGAIGAMIVLYEWVALNASLARTLSITLHLNNTFILLTFLILTAWWASGGRPPQRLAGQRGLALGLGLLVLGVMAVATAGAITALGDTLFRVDSTGEALARSMDGAAHHLERLRVYHPFAAVLMGAALIASVQAVARYRPSLLVRRFGLAVQALYLGQIVLGVANIFLKAPVWMQLVHLLMADAIWIALVLFSCTALAARRRSVPSLEDAAPSLEDAATEMQPSLA